MTTIIVAASLSLDRPGVAGISQWSTLADTRPSAEDGSRDSGIAGWGRLVYSGAIQTPATNPRVTNYLSKEERAKLIADILVYLREGTKTDKDGNVIGRAPIGTGTNLAALLKEPAFPSPMHVCVEPSKPEDPCAQPPGNREFRMAYAPQEKQAEDTIILGQRTETKGVFYVASADGTLKKAVSAGRTSEEFENLNTKNLAVIGDFQNQLQFWCEQYRRYRAG